jgi:O-antigen/teichoic acid export membrane protein
VKLRAVPVLFIANAASAAMGFAVLGVLTRALDPASFGALSTLVTVMDMGVMLVDILMVTGMVQVAARCMETDPRRADMALKIGLLVRLPLLAVIALGGAALASPLSDLLFGTRRWSAEIALACAAVPLLSLAGYCAAVLQAREAFSRLALVTLFKNGARLGLIGGAALLGALNPALALNLMLAAAGICLLLVLPFTPLASLRVRGFDRDVFREIMGVNGWMTVAAVGFLGARIDVLMLSAMTGTVEAGHYAAASQLSLAIMMLSTAIGTTLFPGAAKISTVEAMRAHMRRAGRFLPLGLAAMIAFPLAAGPFVPLLLGSGYGGVEVPFQFLAASAVLTLVTNPLLLIVFPARMLHIYAGTILIQLVIRLCANWVVIPLYGASGAAAVDLGAKAVTIALLVGLILVRLARRDTLGPAPAPAPAQ